MMINSAYLVASVLLTYGICVVALSAEACSAVETGLIHPIEHTRNVLKIDNIAQLACVCNIIELVSNMEFGYSIRFGYNGFTTVFNGMSDCGALRFFARTMAERWRMDQFEDLSDGSTFTLVETSKGDGLTAALIAETVRREVGVPVIAYTHFDPSMLTGGTKDGIAGEAVTSLLNRNIESLGIQGIVLPVTGVPSLTLQMHEDGVADLVYIDGDHSYEATLTNLREAWRILKVGGLLLGAAAYPAHHNVSGVDDALRQFCFERGMVREDGEYDYYSVLLSTGHMFHITKEEGF